MPRCVPVAGESSCRPARGAASSSHVGRYVAEAVRARCTKGILYTYAIWPTSHLGWLDMWTGARLLPLTRPLRLKPQTDSARTRHGLSGNSRMQGLLHAAARLVAGSHDEAHTQPTHRRHPYSISGAHGHDTSAGMPKVRTRHTWLKQPTAADSLFSQPLQRLGPPCPPCLAVPPLKPAESSSFRWARRSRARSFAATSASCQRW